jgi:hypothetical protein
MASSMVHQHGVTLMDGDVTAHSNQLLTLQSRDADDNELQTIIRVDAFTDEGVQLRILQQDHESVELRYCASPALPEPLAYQVPMPLTLDRLGLSPLDAIDLTQQSREAGDGQLERRFAYYAFRHRPVHTPPVPDNADLELRFMDVPVAENDVDVSVAEFIEAAGSLRTVIQGGRPVDGRDFSTPDSENSPGYEAVGAAAVLDSRASQIENQLQELLTLLDNRLHFFGQNAGQVQGGLTYQVDELEEATVAFREAYDMNSLLDALQQIKDAPHTLLNELDELRTHLRAGYLTGSVDEALFANSLTSDRLEIQTELEPHTPVTLRLLPVSDAVDLPVQTKQATVEDEGLIIADFNFSQFEPGTPFLVEITSRASAGVDMNLLNEHLEEAIEETSIQQQQQLLVVLLQNHLLNQTNLRAIIRYRRLDKQGRLAVWQQQPLPIQRLMLFVTGIQEPETELEQLVSEVIHDEEAEELAKIAKELFAQGTIDAQYEVIVRNLSEMPDDIRTAFWLVQPVDVQTQLLDIFEVERPPTSESSESIPSIVQAGRTLPDDNDTFEESTFAFLKQQAPVINALLIIHQWLKKLEANLTPWTRLQRAIDDIHNGRFAAEVNLIRLIKNTPDTLLTGDDLNTIATTATLLTFDLTNLRRQLVDILAPLAQTGLLQLIDRAGNPMYPERVRYIRVQQPDITGIFPKSAEGRIRARIERLLTAPWWIEEPALAEYGAFFRGFAKEHVDGDMIWLLEWSLSEAATLANILQPFSADIVDDFHRLHRLIHHQHTTNITGNDMLVTRLQEMAELFSREEVFETILAANSRFDESILEHLPKLSHLLASLAEYILNPEPLENEPANYDIEVVNTLDRLEVVIITLHNAEDIASAFRAGVLEGIRRLLLRASYFGIYGSVPVSPAGRRRADEARLIRQMQIICTTLQDRYNVAADLNAGTGDVKGQVSRLQAILGDNFVILPPFMPENYAAVQATFADQANLLDGATHAPSLWLQRSIPVQKTTALYQQMRTQARAFALAKGGRLDAVHRRLYAGQLNTTRRQWLGQDDVLPEGGELIYGVSFALTSNPDTPLPSIEQSTAVQPVVGLFIDEWVERTPTPEETAGVALYYDAPSARAPQSIILAVPPAWHDRENTSETESVNSREYAANQPWTMDLIKRSIDETLMMMTLRLVDRTALSQMDSVLPALLMPRYHATDNSVRVPPTASINLNVFNWRI